MCSSDLILPVFNEERYLEQCLNTLRKSKYPKDKYEIITVDNGSTDHSVEIIKKSNARLIIKKDVNNFPALESSCTSLNPTVETVIIVM